MEARNQFTQFNPPASFIRSENRTIRRVKRDKRKLLIREKAEEEFLIKLIHKFDVILEQLQEVDTEVDRIIWFPWCNDAYTCEDSRCCDWNRVLTCFTFVDHYHHKVTIEALNYNKRVYGWTEPIPPQIGIFEDVPDALALGPSSESDSD